MRNTLKNWLPPVVLKKYRDSRDALSRWAEWPQATWHPWRKDSIQKINALKDKHRGQRCFIIGNGPSLKQTDLSLLKNEVTFGMNRIYLMFPELGWQTTYHVAVNDLVIEQCAADIMALTMPHFVSWRSRKWLTPHDNMMFLHSTYTGKTFGRNAAGRLWEGGTVTYAALQVAYHMGFQQAILIGVDHSFTTKGTPNTTITSQGDDPNHFDPKYFGKGFRWQLPDLDSSEQGYLRARIAFEQDGREVIDATVGGKLTIFNKVPYESLFK